MFVSQEVVLMTARDKRLLFLPAAVQQSRPSSWTGVQSFRRRDSKVSLACPERHVTLRVGWGNKATYIFSLMAQCLKGWNEGTADQSEPALSLEYFVKF